MTQSDFARSAVLRSSDLVGWDVVDRAGEKIGTVSDILIDRRGKIRYLDLEYGLPRKHVLMPEEQLEWGDRSFIVGRWAREDVRMLPAYDPQRALDTRALDEMRGAYPWFYSADADEWRSSPAGEDRVVPLADAKGFKLQKGAPDLRGWNVFGSDGERVGTVDHMLVDPAALKIRYISVDLHDDLFVLKDDRRVLIPLEQVDLKERGNDAWVKGATAAEIAALPAYLGGAVHPAMGRAIERVFSDSARVDG